MTSLGSFVNTLTKLLAEEFGLFGTGFQSAVRRLSAFVLDEICFKDYKKIGIYQYCLIKFFFCNSYRLLL